MPSDSQSTPEELAGYRHATDEENEQALRQLREGHRLAHEALQRHGGPGLHPRIAAARSPELHVLAVERAINEHLGGDASVREVVRLMLAMGWAPPTVARRPEPHEIGDIIAQEPANG